MTTRRPGLRVCLESGCPTIGDTPRCAAHRSERERERGSRQERGYGAAHEAIRRTLLARHVEGTLCRACGRPMLLRQGLDAAHTVPLRVDPSAVADHLEHRSCNQAWRQDPGGQVRR